MHVFFFRLGGEKKRGRKGQKLNINLNKRHKVLAAEQRGEGGGPFVWEKERIVLSLREEGKKKAPGFCLLFRC